MSVSRIIKKTPSSNIFIEEIGNITIEESGWVNNVEDTGFWYYDYPKTNMAEGIYVELNVSPQYTNEVEIYTVVAKTNFIRLYAIVLPPTFTCSLKIIGGMI